MSKSLAENLNSVAVALRNGHQGDAECRAAAAKLDEAAAELERLRGENTILRRGMTGDYDLDAWIDWAQEKERLRQRFDSLNEAYCNADARSDAKGKEADQLRAERDQCREAIREAYEAHCAGDSLQCYRTLKAALEGEDDAGGT